MFLFVCFLSIKALAHYHAAISIDINSIESHEHTNNKRDEFQLNNNNSFALSDLTSDINVSPCALKKAHIKESLVYFEESMRLQRMSRDLKVNIYTQCQKYDAKNVLKSKSVWFFLSLQNKVSLTKILKEGSLKATIESECIDEELQNNNFNEDDTFEMIDATVTPSSKFILSLTDPDFTAYKVIYLTANRVQYCRRSKYGENGCRKSSESKFHN